MTLCNEALAAARAEKHNELFDKVNDLAQEVIDECTEHQPSDLGLDPRAGSRLYVDPERTFIAVSYRDSRALNYYGGFEYIGQEYVTTLGDWVFYSGDDERVQGHLSRLGGSFSARE